MLAALKRSQLRLTLKLMVCSHTEPKENALMIIPMQGQSSTTRKVSCELWQLCRRYGSSLDISMLKLRNRVLHLKANK